MIESTWANLLANMPGEWRDTLVVKTMTGTEISVQSIVRIDTNLLVIRGRVAGTTDQGQLYFVPLERLETVCIQRPPKEEEVQKSLAAILSPAPVGVVSKTSDSPRATTVMKLSPEAMEKLKSLGINKSSETQ